MNITNELTSTLVEYSFNNRTHSEQQVDRIANSIKEFGFTQPIVVDESNIILVGHGRLAAAKKLGLESVPVLKLQGLSEAKKRAYRILDNKLQNDSEWNLENLQIELSQLQESDYPIEEWGLNELIAALQKENGGAGSLGVGDERYTKKVESPVYTPKGDKPELDSLYDTSKYDELIEEIEEAKGVSEEVREFLRFAACRHVVFNYEQIAEYYAHASKKLQALMEESMLVIVDFDKAIEKGFVKLVEEIAECFDDDMRIRASED